MRRRSKWKEEEKEERKKGEGGRSSSSIEAGNRCTVRVDFMSIPDLTTGCPDTCTLFTGGAAVGGTFIGLP